MLPDICLKSFMAQISILKEYAFNWAIVATTGLPCYAS